MVEGDARLGDDDVTEASRWDMIILYIFDYTPFVAGRKDSGPQK